MILFIIPRCDCYDENTAGGISAGIIMKHDMVSFRPAGREEAFSACADHVHLYAAIPPKMSAAGNRWNRDTPSGWRWSI